MKTPVGSLRNPDKHRESSASVVNVVVCGYLLLFLTDIKKKIGKIDV